MSSSTTDTHPDSKVQCHRDGCKIHGGKRQTRRRDKVLPIRDWAEENSPRRQEEQRSHGPATRLNVSFQPQRPYMPRSGIRERVETGGAGSRDKKAGRLHRAGSTSLNGRMHDG